jgi:thiosulfate dehydrogenase [quinone] large subunit
MSIIHRDNPTTEQHRHTVDEARTPAVGLIAAGVRVALGSVFLWAFLDKTFGLGHETVKSAAWIHGGSPTKGFLGFAVSGPFEGIYHNIAGQAWADWAFMLGLAFIGTALVLGVAMKAAATSGTILLVLMWTAVLPPENHPFMDDHLIYAGTLVLLAALHAGRVLGFGEKWEQSELVQRNTWLR